MSEVKTVRHEWKNSDGRLQGYNVRFKGGCNINVTFEYICLSCNGHTELFHKRSDDMRGRECPTCKGQLARYHDTAPMLDADYHESQLTHNLGWDE